MPWSWCCSATIGLDTEAPEPIDKIKQLVSAEVRNHKSV